jgi:hypothetical protein
VRVAIDEPGGHDMAAGVDHPLRLTALEVTDGDDLVVSDADVGGSRLARQAVEDDAAANDQVTVH